MGIIRNYFLQRQAEMDSKINNQTMGGVSRNTSRVLNPPGGRSNMSDIFGGGEVGAQQNQKPIEKSPEKQVKSAEMMLPNTSNEILSLKFLGNAFLTDYNRT